MSRKVAKQPTRGISNQLYEELKFTPKGVWVDKFQKEVRVEAHQLAESLKDRKVELGFDLPESYMDQVDRHVDRLMDKGLGDVIAKAVKSGDDSDLEKFMQNEFQYDTKMDFESFLEREMQNVHPNNAKRAEKNLRALRQREKQMALNNKIQQLEKEKKKKEPCKCQKCTAKRLGKTIKELQTPKTVNNVDPVKAARRQAHKARLQVEKLKDAAREARRLTVEAKERVDLYAAVKARKIQDEQEERKFSMQNPHNGLAHKVRVMSGYSKPNPKRRRR